MREILHGWFLTSSQSFMMVKDEQRKKTTEGMNDQPVCVFNEKLTTVGSASEGEALEALAPGTAGYSSGLLRKGKPRAGTQSL